jgi:AraC-like DNA-binding protein
MRESTVAASIVTDMLDYLGRRGIVVEEVARALNLNVAELGKPDQRVPGSRVERLFEEAERRTQDPYVGLHMGESYHPGALNILGYVVLSCRSAAEVLDRLARYASILNDGLRVRVTREGEGTVCRFDALDGLDNYLTRAPRHPIEAMCAGVAVTMRNLTGQAIEPQRIAFRHRAPSDVAEHRRVFGRDARFGATENLLTFLTNDLEAPVRSSNPELLAVFERHASAIIDELDEHGPVSRRVVHLLSERVKGIAPTLDEVAAELAMSARSVQRALRAEGTSYQLLLDDVRRELAVRHLAVRGTSAAEVAFLTGFSEPSAFSRAFRRWTGSTPGAYCTGQNEAFGAG